MTATANTSAVNFDAVQIAISIGRISTLGAVLPSDVSIKIDNLAILTRDLLIGGLESFQDVNSVKQDMIGMS